MEKYFVIENRNVGSIGKPMLEEKVLYSGTKEECVAFEDAKRKEYKDRTKTDCYIKSESERKQLEEINKFWNSLSDDEKKENIIVNGKVYNRALYNFHNGNKQ